MQAKSEPPNNRSITINHQAVYNLSKFNSMLNFQLKKPNSTKFYFFWSIGSEKNQKILINNSKNIKYAVSNGNTDQWSQPIEIKNPILYNYIDKKFQIINKIGNRNILLKKD